MRQFIFTILSPNRIFEIQGKQVRTPCEFVVDENELELYELKIKADGDTEYSVREKEAKIYKVITRDSVKIKDKKQIQMDIKKEKLKSKNENSEIAP
jgi:hypothetical protein